MEELEKAKEQAYNSTKVQLTQSLTELNASDEWKIYLPGRDIFNVGKREFEQEVILWKESFQIF
ncbi:MAG: hypothetical protein ACFFBD_30430 [Candidatus Hodarchaeota archaeon]